MEPRHRQSAPEMCSDTSSLTCIGGGRMPGACWKGSRDWLNGQAHRIGPAESVTMAKVWKERCDYGEGESSRLGYQTNKKVVIVIRVVLIEF